MTNFERFQEIEILLKINVLIRLLLYLFQVCILMMHKDFRVVATLTGYLSIEFLKDYTTTSP